MQDLKVTLVQPSPIWQNIDENLASYSSMLGAHALKTDIIVLPEMFTTGFTMESEKMAEKMHGKTHRWMQEQALKLNSAICGSVIIYDNNNFYNRFLWVESDGKTIHYDKKHLFRMADENNFYAAGNKQVIINYQGWKIRPLVCYDLRFPIWSRNKVSEKEFNYDMLLFVANWPQARVLAWNTLLRARAIENFAYCLGVNRVGMDEKDVVYNGQSVIYGPKGEDICLLGEKEDIRTTTLEKASLDDYRQKFPGYMDADEFEIINV
jgi:omega-amidase